MENTTQKPNTDKVIDVRDDEIKKLREENEQLRKENDKLREENEQVKADLKLQTSLYKFECEQNRSLNNRIEAIKHILEI